MNNAQKLNLVMMGVALVSMGLLGWLIHHTNWVEHQKCLAMVIHPELCP